MLSKKTIMCISEIFCGDTNHYSYKTGENLVKFFNSYFNESDIYGPDFPSRKTYVYNKLCELLSSNSFDQFLNIILNKHYIMKDCNLSLVEAANFAESICKKLNEIVQKDQYKIVTANNKYHLCDNDFQKIGSGGFSIVYKQKSTGLIIKKLQENLLKDKKICNRFKKEFDIINSLKDISGIIKVYSFDEKSHFYTMEAADQTLDDLIQKSDLDENSKINYIKRILNIMREVHNRNIIHRDLCPKNILVVNNELKIADFGISKNLVELNSQQTQQTNGLGHFTYCAPEQILSLKDSSIKSDIYSLGKIINFIMTQNANSNQHIFYAISIKATNIDPSLRHKDLEELIDNFETLVKNKDNKNIKKNIINKISQGIYDDYVENYIYTLDIDEILKLISDEKNEIINCLLEIMQRNKEYAQNIMEKVFKNYENFCEDFESYDPFAYFAYIILINDDSCFDYVIKERAAEILRYVAYKINRYYAQDLVREILEKGIDILLEEILKNKSK